MSYLISLSVWCFTCLTWLEPTLSYPLLPQRGTAMCLLNLFKTKQILKKITQHRHKSVHRLQTAQRGVSYLWPLSDMTCNRWRGRSHIWFSVGIFHVGVATDDASGSVMKSGLVQLKQGVFTPTVNYTVHIKRLALQELFIQQPGTHCLITGFNQSRKLWLRVFFNILPRSTKMTRRSGGELTFYLPSVKRHVCHLWLYTANVEKFDIISFFISFIWKYGSCRSDLIDV